MEKIEDLFPGFDDVFDFSKTAPIRPIENLDKSELLERYYELEKELKETKEKKDELHELIERIKPKYNELVDKVNELRICVLNKKQKGRNGSNPTRVSDFNEWKKYFEDGCNKSLMTGETWQLYHVSKHTFDKNYEEYCNNIDPQYDIEFENYFSSIVNSPKRDACYSDLFDLLDIHFDETDYIVEERSILIGADVFNRLYADNKIKRGICFSNLQDECINRDRKIIGKYAKKQLREAICAWNIPSKIKVKSKTKSEQYDSYEITERIIYNNWYHYDFDKDDWVGPKSDIPKKNSLTYFDASSAEFLRNVKKGERISDVLKCLNASVDKNKFFYY